jgi:hypothetical protein
MNSNLGSRCDLRRLLKFATTVESCSRLDRERKRAHCRHGVVRPAGVSECHSRRKFSNKNVDVYPWRENCALDVEEVKGMNTSLLSASLLLIVLTLGACATNGGSGGAGQTQSGASEAQAAGEEKEKGD